jgi:hypothetical protein
MSKPNHSEILFFYMISFLDLFDEEYKEEKCSKFLVNKKQKLIQYTFCTKEKINTLFNFFLKVKSDRKKYPISQPSKELILEKIMKSGIESTSIDIEDNYRFEVIIHTNKDCDADCPKCTISEVESKNLADAIEIFEELLNATIKAELESLHIRFVEDTDPFTNN